MVIQYSLSIDYNLDFYNSLWTNNFLYLFVSCLPTFSKFDKNLANYLATSKIYIDCYNSNIQNNTTGGNNESCGQHVDEGNDDSSNSQLSGSPKAMAPAAANGMDMATEENNNMSSEVDSKVASGQLSNSEVDSVINSLPDMNEIESFDGHMSSQEKDQDQDQEQAATCTQKQQQHLELNVATANSSSKYHLYTPHSTKLHHSHTHSHPHSHPYSQLNNHHQHHHHQPSSPVSSMSSSSASVSPILSEIGGVNSNMFKQHMLNPYKDWTNNNNNNCNNAVSGNSSSGSLDMGLGMSSSLPNKKIFNRNIHCVKEKIRR